MNKWTIEWLTEWINEQINEWINEWTDEWMNQWMNQWMKYEWNMNESMNEPMNERTILWFVLGSIKYHKAFTRNLLQNSRVYFPIWCILEHQFGQVIQKTPPCHYLGNKWVNKETNPQCFKSYKVESGAPLHKSILYHIWCM